VLRLRACGVVIMVVNKTTGGRTLSLSTTANGTAVAVVGNVSLQSGVPLLPKSPSFHSGLDLLAGRDKSSIIMYCDPTIHLPRLHGKSHRAGVWVFYCSGTSFNLFSKFENIDKLPKMYNIIICIYIL